jgi:hypothetical protein
MRLPPVTANGGDEVRERSAASLEKLLDTICNGHDVDAADSEDKLNEAGCGRALHMRVDDGPEAHDCPEDAGRTSGSQYE